MMAGHQYVFTKEGLKRAEANGLSPLAGFVLNPQKVTAEMAAMEKVKSRYIVPLAVGMTSDIESDLVNAVQQLDQAGFRTFIAELQDQLDAFAATSK